MSSKKSDSEFWLDVLNVSTEFQCERARAAAIEHLGPLLTPVNKVWWARRYDVQKWLLDAYRDICIRSIAIQVEDMEKIGGMTAIILYETREKLRDFRQVPPSDYRPGEWVTNYDHTVLLENGGSERLSICARRVDWFVEEAMNKLKAHEAG